MGERPPMPPLGEAGSLRSASRVAALSEGGPCPRPTGCGPRQPPSPPLTPPFAEKEAKAKADGLEARLGDAQRTIDLLVTKMSLHSKNGPERLSGGLRRVFEWRAVNRKGGGAPLGVPRP
jgi:hypothetical protein